MKLASTDIHFRGLGELLLEYCTNAREEILLVAPFVKFDTLRCLVECSPTDIPLTCVTRWRPTEILAGASDLNIWPLLKSRKAARLFLLDSLHAKYFRFDDFCFIGSANLTGSALGWTSHPNLEILTLVSRTSAATRHFEALLWKEGVEVTDDIYAQFQYFIAGLQSIEPDIHMVSHEPIDRLVPLVRDRSTSEERASAREYWVPSLRHPELLYEAYTNNLESLTSAASSDALKDLAVFRLPEGLFREAFRLHVGWHLFQMPIVQQIDAFVATPQRFGAVRDFLKTLPCANRQTFDSSDAWQTLMRWLLYFLGDRYQMSVANYSEIFCRSDRL